MEKQELLGKIDALAIAICRPMDTEKKNEFFEFQEKRRESGECLKQKYYVGRTYYKGDRRGEERDVYEVEGKGFNELWRLLSSFAFTIVNNFYCTRKIFNEDTQDALFDIKYQTLYVLRFFGPEPSGSSFSQFFPLICKNILSTISRRMYGTKDEEYTKEEGDALVLAGKGDKLVWDEENYRWIKKGAVSNKTKVNFQTVSLHNEIMIEEEEGSGYKIDYIESNDNEFENIEFQACIPKEYKKLVNCVVDGYSLKETAEMVGMELKSVKKLLVNFATDFYN